MKDKKIDITNEEIMDLDPRKLAKIAGGNGDISTPNCPGCGAVMKFAGLFVNDTPNPLLRVRLRYVCPECHYANFNIQ